MDVLIATLRFFPYNIQEGGDWSKERIAILSHQPGNMLRMKIARRKNYFEGPHKGD